MNFTQMGGRTIMQPRPYSNNNITVVGCGGIGARIVATLVKLLPQNENRVLHLYDFDMVEPKNLLRQHFSMADLGMNKAEALAERYATPFLDVQAHPVKWEGQHNGGNILILAVDNWQARKLGVEQTRVVAIDCGNDGPRGQVLLGGVLDGFPLATHAMHFPELLTEGPPTPCDAADTQTVTANQMAATLALAYVEALVQGQPLGHCGLMFALPNGVWEIPVRAKPMPQRKRVLVPLLGWNKAIANTYRTGDVLSADPAEAEAEKAVLVKEVRQQFDDYGVLLNCHCKFCNGERVKLCQRLDVDPTWLPEEIQQLMRGETGYDQNDPAIRFEFETVWVEEIDHYGQKLRVVEHAEAQAAEGEAAAGGTTHVAPDDGEDELPDPEPDCDCEDCRAARGE